MTLADGGTMESQRVLTRVRRAVAVIFTVVVVALGLAGCGTDPASVGGGGLGPAMESPEMQKQRYNEAMAQVRGTIEDPQAPPIDRSVATGNRKQLLAMAMRWDEATAIVKSVTPPANITAEHANLAKAMTELGDWNRRIAKVAPNRSATKRTFRQAQASDASRRFGEAVRAIEAKGYAVMSDPEAGPLDSASPVE
jgi:hypothetical protein